MPFCLWSNIYVELTTLDKADYPPSWRMGIQTEAQVSDDVYFHSGVKTLSVLRLIEGPFTWAHNATKVWWLSNLFKQAPWQSHRFTPGPQSLSQKKLHPPKIPTQIKHTDDITVYLIFFSFLHNIPVVLPY